MRRHTIEGERILERIDGVLAEVGRIVTCCDAFSAMTTTRSYRKAMPTADALAELRRCSGTQFDPDVASVLVDLVEAGEI